MPGLVCPDHRLEWSSSYTSQFLPATLCSRGESQRTLLRFLLGPLPTATNFLGRPPGSPPAAWFNVPQYFGMANLSLQAPANPNLLLSSGTTTGNPLTSGHLFFNNVNFASTADASGGRESMFALAGPDIQVYNSYFLSGSNQDLRYFLWRRRHRLRQSLCSQ